MGPVETLSINTIDVPHASGQVGIRALDQEMIMASALLPLFMTWYHAFGYCILNGLDMIFNYHF